MELDCIHSTWPQKTLFLEFRQLHYTRGSLKCPDRLEIFDTIFSWWKCMCVKFDVLGERGYDLWPPLTIQNSETFIRRYICILPFFFFPNKIIIWNVAWWRGGIVCQSVDTACCVLLEPITGNWKMVLKGRWETGHRKEGGIVRERKRMEEGIF